MTITPITFSFTFGDVTIEDIPDAALDFGARSWAVPFTYTRRAETTLNKALAVGTFTLRGTVDVTRSELATAAGKVYRNLTMQERANAMQTVLQTEIAAILAKLKTEIGA